jgi:hypothetical protein
MISCYLLSLMPKAAKSKIADGLEATLLTVETGIAYRGAAGYLTKSFDRLNC